MPLTLARMTVLLLEPLGWPVIAATGAEVSLTQVTLVALVSGCQLPAASLPKTQSVILPSARSAIELLMLVP